jgi:Fe2+ transport system protein FeoA
MTLADALTLDCLPRGTRARILRIGTDAADDLEDLLLGLGFEEGAAVEVRHQGAFGGPIAVRVDDRLIALRPADAAVVTVEVTHEAAAQAA